MRLSVGSNRYTNCPGSNITLSKFQFYDQQELNNPPSVTPRPLDAVLDQETLLSRIEESSGNRTPALGSYTT
jgi:hypothetical protein